MPKHHDPAHNPLGPQPAVTLLPTRHRRPHHPRLPLPRAPPRIGQNRHWSIRHQRPREGLAGRWCQTQTERDWPVNGSRMTGNRGASLFQFRLGGPRRPPWKPSPGEPSAHPRRGPWLPSDPSWRRPLGTTLMTWIFAWHPRDDVELVLPAAASAPPAAGAPAKRATATGWPR